jgi:hypothetical protein
VIGSDSDDETAGAYNLHNVAIRGTGTGNAFADAIAVVAGFVRSVCSALNACGPDNRMTATPARTPRAAVPPPAPVVLVAPPELSWNMVDASID